MHLFDSTSITVVIPTAARRSTLKAAIVSAVNQLPAPSRILVVDDSAELSAQGIAQEIGDPSVEWTPNKRTPGPSGARNTGLHLASTPIVAFLDDDDCYEPDFIARSLETWNRSSPDTIAIWTAIIEEYENGSESRLHVWTPKGRTAHERFVDSVVYSNFGTGHGLSVNRERFLELGAFDESLRAAEDTEALFRILLSGPINTIDLSLVRVRRFGGDRLRTNATEYAKAMDFLKYQYAARLSSSPLALHWLERSRMRRHMLAGHRHEGGRIVSKLLQFGPLKMRIKALAIFTLLLLGIDPTHKWKGGRRYRRAKQRQT